MGGKKNLIKAITQAIPTYTMSCFRLPSNLCEEINRNYAMFWWGSSSKAKKIHWRKWSDLCLRKESSGMGFREISLFNQAILAKQCLRIVRNSDSLLS